MQRKSQIYMLRSGCNVHATPLFFSCLVRGSTVLVSFVIHGHRLAGLVVKASASGVEDPGLESRLRRDFVRVESYQWLKKWHSSGYPVRRLVFLSQRWDWSASVSILWLGEVESLICNFYLSVAACKIVWAAPSLRYTSMLLGRQATNKQHRAELHPVQTQVEQDLAAYGRPGVGIIEDDDRQVTTVQPSFHHRHSTNRECHEALPSSANDEVRCDCTFADMTMVTLHDTRFVECRWWNDGWTVKSVVTWRSLDSMIPAPEQQAVGITARLTIHWINLIGLKILKVV